jgi:hypothetical protein
MIFSGAAILDLPIVQIVVHVCILPADM